MSAENITLEKPASAGGGARRAFTWLREGYRLMHGAPRLWFGMTLLYFLMAAILRLVPFMGGLVLILISPWLLAAALVAVREPESVAGKTWLDAVLVTPLRRFALPVRDEHRLAALAIACVLVFGFALLIRIAEELFLKGGAMATGLEAGGLAPRMGVGFVAAAAVVSSAYLALLMAVFYLVPLVMFHGRAPMEAMIESFQACWRNAGAWLLLVGMFFVPYALIVFAYAWIPWTGVMLTLTLGFLLLPLFVATSFASFEALFGAAGPASP